MTSTKHILITGASSGIGAACALHLDRSGRVFGARRYQTLAVYLLLTVVIPIIGMAGELD